MDSITIGWNKHSSDEVQFLTNRQYFQQDSTEKINNQDNKFNKKKVHFNCNTPNIKQQAFENTEQNYSKTNRTQTLVFGDHDYISSSPKTFTSELSENNHEPICSARGIIITFIFIIFIIIAAAIAVGIVFGTIKTSQSTTKNADQSSFSTVSTVSTVPIIAMTSSVSIGSQNGAPCLSYTTINDPSRSVMQTGSSRPCDNGPLFNASGHGAWIRFVGNGGTIIPLSSPGENHCGSYTTGWFNGTLPTTLGTVVNGSVCFASDGFDCIAHYTTSVIYCIGSFYIYLLQPAPLCNSRYCTA